MIETSPNPLRRNRTMLVAIFAIFFGSLFVAGVLRFSGWRPAAMKSHGELLQPYGDLRAVVPKLADGRDYQWNSGARLWRIALAPPSDCIEPCIKLGQDLDKVWQLTGQNADHVHILWIGTPPAAMPRDAALRVLQPSAALRAGLPRVDEITSDGRRGVPVYLIDPNGFVVLRYAPGFDAAGLRADLSKLLKLM